MRGESEEVGKRIEGRKTSPLLQCQGSLGRRGLCCHGDSYPGLDAVTVCVCVCVCVWMYCVCIFTISKERKYLLSAIAVPVLRIA